MKHDEDSALFSHPAERIDSALQDVACRKLVHQFSAAGAAGVGVDQRPRHRLRRPALVPEQDRQIKVRYVARKGAAGLASRRFAAIQVERQADDDALHLLLRDELRQGCLVLAEFAACNGVRRAGNRPARIAQGKADCLRADIKPDQPPARG